MFPTKTRDQITVRSNQILRFIYEMISAENIQPLFIMCLLYHSAILILQWFLCLSFALSSLKLSSEELFSSALVILTSGPPFHTPECVCNVQNRWAPALRSSGLRASDLTGWKINLCHLYASWFTPDNSAGPEQWRCVRSAPLYNRQPHYRQIRI